MAGNTVDITIKAIDKASRELKKIRDELSGMDKAGKKTSESVLSLGKALAGLGALKVAKEIGEFAFEAATLSARVETLGVVTETLGRNLGYSSTEIKGMERSIQELGITTQGSRKALALMMQANLDLTQSTDLARMAQDAAVIAGVNSTEAFERLVGVISAGNVQMARSMGIQVDFEKAYKRQAEALGITTEQLTATQKTQARANAVLAEGEQIANAYASAMESVGKQLTSTPRYFEEFKVAVGESFIPVLGEANRALQGFLKSETSVIDFNNLLMEAQREGVITSWERIRLWNEGSRSAERQTAVIDQLTEKMDAEALASENAAENERLFGNALLGVREAIRNQREELDNASNSFENLEEKELRKLQVDAILAGDYSLATAIGNQIALIETEAARLEDLINILDELDGKTVDASVMIQMYAQPGTPDFGSTIMNNQGDWTPPSDQGTVTYNGLTYRNAYWEGNQLMRNGQVILNRASGGPLTGVNIVGEAGPELIVNGNVIPATQTRRLMNAGLRPGGRYQGGGSLWDEVGINPYAPNAGMKTMGIKTGGVGSAHIQSASEIGGSASAASSPAVAAAAAAAGVSMSQVQMMSAQFDKLDETLGRLATAADIERAMRTALELAML